MKISKVHCFQLWQLFVLKPFPIFFVIYDCVTMTCDRCVTICDMMLTPNPKSRKWNKKYNIIVLESSIMFFVTMIVTCDSHM